MMSTTANKAIVCRFYEEVFNQRNVDAIDELVHAEFINNDLTPAASRDIPSMKQFIKTITQAFPEHPGSYIALAFDSHGTMIEFHPFGTTLIPGEIVDRAANIRPDPAALIYTANHIAISVPISIAQIHSIALREGWQMLHCCRGENYFDVIEFWVENQVLFELLRPELVNKYLTFLKRSKSTYKINLPTFRKSRLMAKYQSSYMARTGSGSQRSLMSI